MRISLCRAVVKTPAPSTSYIAISTDSSLNDEYFVIALPERSEAPKPCRLITIGVCQFTKMHGNSAFMLKPISLFLALALALALIWPTDHLWAQGKPPEGPSPIVAGRIVKVRRASVETFVGTLQAKRKSTVGSAVEGRVVSIAVEQGDPVGADPDLSTEKFVGQPLVQLRTGTLDIEIGTAEIQFKLAKQAADELQVSLPKEIELAEARASEAKARLDYSKLSYDRSIKLGGAKGAISQGEIDQARSQYLADQQSANAEDIDYQRLMAISELRLLQVQLRVESSQQELARLNDLKAKYTIRAPFEGFITEKLTEVGEWVTRGQPIVEVIQIDPIEMIINVPQIYVTRLQQSLSRNDAASDRKIPLSAKILIDGFDEPLTGVVKRVIAQADLRSRTFPVRLEIENPETISGYLLQPGMLGKASIQIGVENEMLLVKKDALVLGGRQPTVYKIIQQGSDTTAIPIAVTTGATVGDWIQITGNISSKDRIVLLGNERLRPGQKLSIKETSEEVPPS